MKCKYITIEREYGAGGSQIAQRLSEICGIPCYGKEILEAVAKRQKISVDSIEKYEETVTNSFLYTIFMMSRAQSGNTEMLTQEEHIYLAEQKEIQNFADKGSAIFVGHCASEALKNRKNVVNVYILADIEDKKKRIRQEYKIPASEAESTRKRFDKKRANYYYANTGKKWDDLRNYNLVLDSSRLGVEGCAAVLKSLLEMKEES